MKSRIADNRCIRVETGQKPHDGFTIFIPLQVDGDRDAFEQTGSARNLVE